MKFVVQLTFKSHHQQTVFVECQSDIWISTKYKYKYKSWNKKEHLIWQVVCKLNKYQFNNSIFCAWILQTVIVSVNLYFTDTFVFFYGKMSAEKLLLEMFGHFFPITTQGKNNVSWFCDVCSQLFSFPIQMLRSPCLLLRAVTHQSLKSFDCMSCVRVCNRENWNSSSVVGVNYSRWQSFVNF